MLEADLGLAVVLVLWNLWIPAEISRFISGALYLYLYLVERRFITQKSGKC